MSTKSMAHYRAKLVEIILNDEDLNLAEQSVCADVERMSDNTVFELLNIEPDPNAIQSAEDERLAAQQEQDRISTTNQYHERLSKLSGAARIAAIMDMERNSDLSSLLPTSERDRLESGELTGHNRIAAALNQMNA
ncbi:Uncharacterised protein [Vibrio cholerae]|nr:MULTISPECIES: hypothetical protein [Vibrio]ELG2042947.1 hypothetical protein [Vibrio fluvialis]ELL4669145.1 hypothetical protein [Vibrio fluvialis]KQA15678.1 hypothetical protein XM60_02965 [Vibrio cholerae]KQA84412.1 hypothetical protein XV86_04215 [Vibrio cholerae]KQA91979.1 hypothetical protein XV88_01590 [Vibrio cholerae]